MKSVPIERLYANRFGEEVPIEKSRVFGAIKEIYENPTIKNKDTVYWKLLDWYIEKQGSAFGWVRSDEDKNKRVNDVKKLIKSMRDNGYSEDLERKVEIDGVVYGDLSVKEEGGNYAIVDGHHRICIMIIMGDKFIKARVNGRT